MAWSAGCAEPPGGEAEPAGWRQPGVAACVGLGVLMLLGGIAVVVRIPWWLVTAPFVVIGLALMFRELTGRDIPRPKGRAAIITLVAIGAFVAVAGVEAVVGFRFPLHAWDDMRAYLPLAHRLIDTYGLEDAWNARRLQTVGGFTFLQAIPVAIFGDTGVGIIETMLAGIFLAGLFVANGVRTTWARLVSVVFILAIPFFWVPRINTTGVLMGTPLLVAVLAITVELRRALRGNRPREALRWAVAGGLVVAALMSVRPNLGLLAAVLIAGGTIWVSGNRSPGADPNAGDRGREHARRARTVVDRVPTLGRHPVLPPRQRQPEPRANPAPRSQWPRRLRRPRLRICSAPGRTCGLLSSCSSSPWPRASCFRTRRSP